MLEDVINYLHNPFTQNEYGLPIHMESGKFEITDDNMLSLPFMLDGQRFVIRGSVLNDGVYTYHESGIMNDDDDDWAGLRAEEFYGVIYAMAVPPAVIAISAEIKEWVAKYATIVNSPYQSESFGGYSYTKANGAGGSGNGGSVSWQEVFGRRLKTWRKPC